MSLFLSCSLFNYKDVNEYDIIVSEVSAFCIDTNYTASKRSSPVIPPVIHKRIKNFVYEVIIVLELNRNISLWDKPIGIVCTPMDGNQQDISLNSERRILSPDNKHEFIFFLLTERKGGVILELGLVDESTGEVIVNNNKFLGKNFYLE
jgi:hypothetical protein